MHDERGDPLLADDHEANDRGDRQRETDRERRPRSFRSRSRERRLASVDGPERLGTHGDFSRRDGQRQERAWCAGLANDQPLNALHARTGVDRERLEVRGELCDVAVPLVTPLRETLFDHAIETGGWVRQLRRERRWLLGRDRDGEARHALRLERESRSE